MRHPFDVTDKAQDQDRRCVLGKGLMIAGGVIGLTAAEQAMGREMTTMAIGEEGGKKPRPPKATTRRLGEEGGKVPPVKTTKAIGEEGGRPITRARNEHGGPIATTMALGEEAGRPRPIYRGPLTAARCEEGGRFRAKSRSVRTALGHLRRAEALKDEGDYIQAYRQIEQTASCSDSDIRSLRSRQLSTLDYAVRTAVMQADKDLKAGDNTVEAIAVHIALGKMPKLRYAPKATKTTLADLKNRGEYASAEQELEAGPIFRQARRLVLESRTADNAAVRQVQVKAARELLGPLSKTFPKAPSAYRAAELLKTL